MFAVLFGILALTGSSFPADQDSSAVIEKQVKDVMIYEYRGLATGEIYKNHLEFIVFPLANSTRKLSIFVWPDQVMVKLREDKQMITTLSANFANGASIYLPVNDCVGVDSATVFVPTAEDLKAWQEYFDKLKKRFTISGAIVGAKEAFVQAEHYVLFEISNDARKEKVYVKVSGLTVRLIENKLLDSVYLEAEWGNRYQTNMGAMPPAATIIVYSESDHKEWTSRLKEWQEKIKPHRILPPKE